MNKQLHFILCFTLLFFLIGCTMQDKPSTSETKNAEQMNYPVSHNNVTDFILAEFDSVSKAKAIEYESKLIVAIQATTFQQINEQKIERKIKKELKKQFEYETIEVSSDQKIFMEINKMEKEGINKNHFNHIKKLLKDNA
ncbi:hypothetical protein Pryu01_02313 [Paraliobacillus ryukyuensis]|uniref:Sporulation lipoprotein YhcN/YlaJ n=1 Tax=Paraliobacillus ryukyuensis TaxID=200904 RepID=A0A366DYD0_9BACI|nr:YhcN/YlaJ family sporulation lipoprotein [Paraliobacillus ryukyuensis]RBO94529.1 sporulation lipoprotein YhcN/YlaJ [Paraliobacillus ryukyuensis]